MRDFYQIVRTGRKAERKSYNYYEDLKFLLSVQTGRFKFTKNSSYITHNIQAIESDNIKSESDASDANPCDPLLDTDTIPEFDSNQESKTDINKNLQLNVANIRKDEDMLFFLSLMPDYKKFTSEQKYRFKMAVMDLMSKEVAMNQLISS